MHILQNIEGSVVILLTYESEGVINKIKDIDPYIILIDFDDDVKIISLIMSIKNVSEANIVVFSEYMGSKTNLMDFGVIGVMCKRSKPSQIVSMISAIRDGHTIIPIKKIHQTNKSEDSSISLTQREMEIISLVIEGHTNSQIAKMIYLSTRTVENYLHRIYVKLGVLNRVGAVEKVIREKII